MSELYRDFIDGKADEIINSLGGTITPAPANAELYRDFLERKFDDVINASAGIVRIKTHTYNGTGTNPNTITFSDTVTAVLYIGGGANSSGDSGTVTELAGIIYRSDVPASTSYKAFVHYYNPSVAGFYRDDIVWLDDKTLQITGNGVNIVFNETNKPYTVLYI